jgi:hypothetical protein
MTSKGIPQPVTPSTEGPKRTRSVHIEMADNGYIVRICDSDYKEIQLVFPSQTAMLKTVREATSMHQEETK